MDKLELFHAIHDENSALVRRFIVENDLTARILFRNIFYPEGQAALLERGGTSPPALWTGERLIIDANAIVEYLRGLVAAA
jgi:hypothetical protein